MIPELEGLKIKKAFSNSSLDTAKPGAEALKTACQEAYKAHPQSCSHAVNAVIRAMHDFTETEWPQKQANLLIDYLVANWVEVNLEQAYELAQAGSVVVGGKKEDNHGHVIVVFPGPKKGRGGYSYTRKGEVLQVRVAGSYPLAMSTSIGSWPGAMSNGDKTVWDPWGNDDAFDAVRFWARRDDVSASAKVMSRISSRRAFA